MAPLVFKEPAPFLSGLYSIPESSWIPTDVYWRIAFTAFGVSDGWFG